MNSLALFACSLAAVALANRADAQSVHIQAYVDGRSNLILDDDSATWQHFDWAAPGRLDCNMGAEMQPTILDGVTWWPGWPDVPDCENRDCGGCFSSTIVGLPHPLPNADFTPQIVVHHARGPVTIVEWPSSTNGWRAVIEFEDTYFGAADWYDVEFSFSAVGVPYCTSTINSSGAAATISVSGSLSVAVNDLVLHAQGGPVGRPGLFFYGLAPAELPFADGWLCVSPFAPGLVRLQPVQVIDMSGTASLAVDLTSLPPWAPIAPGTTAYFQFWFRDLPAGGAGSNLTDGVQATFLP
ncbi:MAG: hypothetical protein L6Q99_12545 [Planctomycetes bacterium]|nr:hypothetical protein [Planctomycetota bacterium]